MLKIGSHVSLSSPHYLVGSVNEALSYNANSFMVYSGAPQNTRRVSTSLFRLDEAKELMKEANIPQENVILHAPYIINLANTVKESTYELAVDFLVQEIQRAQEMDIKVMVLHPGSHVGAGVQLGTQQIIKGLNEVMSQVDMKDTIIALETMAGKGTEIGRSFEELKAIYDGVIQKENIGYCLDTCHIHDAGYDVSDFDAVLDQFDLLLGLSNLKVVHVNDSKNLLGAGKDRHANIGYGEIGFDNLIKIIYHPRLAHLPKILETPYIDKKAPYKLEINSIIKREFEDKLIERIQADE